MRSSPIRFSSLSPYLPAERALSERRRGGQRCQLSTGRGRLPNQYLGNTTSWPLTSSGKTSCDGSTSEFRIVDLITHHDVSADEQLSGSGYFGFGPTAPFCHSFVETF